jgi:hypothetical protein
MMKALLTVAILCVFVAAVHASESQESSRQQLDFFESKIRPVLVEYCYECHSSQSKIVQGGMRLDDRQAIQKGGDSGAAVVPGDREASLILRALRYDGFEILTYRHAGYGFRLTDVQGSVIREIIA